MVVMNLIGYKGFTSPSKRSHFMYVANPEKGSASSPTIRWMGVKGLDKGRRKLSAKAIPS